MAFGNLYNGKKVFVTGHTGFKGSWLCQWLLDLGATVAGYSSEIPTQPSNFEILNLSEKIKDYRSDIRDFDSLQKALKEFSPEIVFHLAAQSLVRKSYDQAKLTFDVNLGGTVNILEAIKKVPTVKTLVLITSDKCYENIEKDYGYKESDLLGGKDPYSASKACAEIAARAFFHSFFSESNQVRMATARAGNVIGGGDWAEDRVVPDFMRAWSTQNSLKIRNPQATRPWQHVLEPLSGYLWLGSKLWDDNQLSGESFNFGPSTDVCPTVGDLIQLIQQKLNSNTNVIADSPSSKKESNLLKLSCEKAYQQLGWSATLSFDQTAQMTADWYRAFYNKDISMSKIASSQIKEFHETAKNKKLLWAIG